MVEVDPELLHSGAKMTHGAAKHVASGADQLAGTSVPSGIFGDFPAAENFHARLTVHHQEHVALMRQHHAVLANVGDKAHAAATGFVRTDDENAASIRSVGRDAV
ncbi:DUF2563 family protein [Mycobacterium branderi]|uniref:DUF2563 domain-containing protein n=1 Tax=Mycobacterium branderi TaxID=43348 RepID=A0A7I7WDH4_9MYCO|nr:DUF2563 family protein [Mycobacterium branderi]MCV7235273.1 DUF2563 family protein [Mycobacterium branderi]ORA29886.1 hypothetical protein BST20_27865 [Mycobacterium branderi]BBZ15047.1 hypothetical protein MBRA_52420 [Mycobacterium branderi]